MKIPESFEKEFAPYQESLELKELGFDERCISFYDEIKFSNNIKLSFLSQKVNDILNTIKNTNGTLISAPTFSQAFRWFREKYNIHAELYTADMGAIEYCFQIRDLYSEKYIYDNFNGAGSSYMGTFNTYEEAELACLIKLIEIVKEKQL